MDQRIVVFGSRGFLGSHILFQIDKKFNAISPTRQEVNLNKQKEIVKILLPNDIVINSTGYANASDSSRQGAEKFARENVESIENLMKACETIGIRQLIHISSVAAMGVIRGDVKITEDMIGTISSTYASSKCDGEKIIKAMTKNVPFTIIRPTSVFGKGRSLANVLCKIAKLPLVPLPNSGRNFIPFTYVENVVQGVQICVNNPLAFNETFIVGDSESYELSRIIKNIGFHFHNNPRIITFDPPLLRNLLGFSDILSSLIGISPLISQTRWDFVALNTHYSIEKIANLGYSPSVSLEIACEKIASYYKLL